MRIQSYFLVPAVSLPLHMKGGRVQRWSRMAWNWKGMANTPMMTSASARLAMYLPIVTIVMTVMMVLRMYMLVTVRSLRKMTMYMTRLFPMTATMEVTTYREMKNTVKITGNSYSGSSSLKHSLLLT